MFLFGPLYAVFFYCLKIARKMPETRLFTSSKHCQRFAKIQVEGGANPMVSMIPENCRKSVRRVMYAMNVSEDAAYAMLMMTALLMDLYPEDEDVVRMILTDNGVPEIA